MQVRRMLTALTLESSAPPPLQHPRGACCFPQGPRYCPDLGWVMVLAHNSRQGLPSMMREVATTSSRPSRRSARPYDVASRRGRIGQVAGGRRKGVPPSAEYQSCPRSWGRPRSDQFATHAWHGMAWHGAFSQRPASTGLSRERATERRPPRSQGASFFFSARASAAGNFGKAFSTKGSAFRFTPLRLSGTTASIRCGPRCASA